MAFRGVVVTPQNWDPETLAFHGVNHIHSISLRHYLLYWDRIDYPSTNIFSFSLTPDEEFLISSGHMIRTAVEFESFSGPAGLPLILAQIHAFQAHEESKPGHWALAQEGPKLFLPPEQSIESRVVEVELYQALPVPTTDVPLQDIIWFKERRAPELLALRSALDDLYQDVVRSGDLPRARVNAIQKVERTLADINQVANESWSTKFLSTLKAELNISNLAVGVTGGVSAATAIGVAEEYGAICGVAATALKFEIKLSRRPLGLPDHLAPFAYAHYIKQELK